MDGNPSGSRCLERPQKKGPPKTGCFLGFVGWGISQRIRSEIFEDSETLQQYGKYFIVYRVWYIPGKISSLSSTKAGFPEGRFNHQPEKKSCESRFPVNTSILLIDKKYRWGAESDLCSLAPGMKKFKGRVMTIGMPHIPNATCHVTPKK